MFGLINSSEAWWKKKSHKITDCMEIGLKFSLPVEDIRTEFSPVDLRKWCYWGAMSSESACYPCFHNPSP